MQAEGAEARADLGPPRAAAVGGPYGPDPGFESNQEARGHSISPQTRRTLMANCPMIPCTGVRWRVGFRSVVRGLPAE